MIDQQIFRRPQPRSGLNGAIGGVCVFEPGNEVTHRTVDEDGNCGRVAERERERNETERDAARARRHELAKANSPVGPWISISNVTTPPNDV